MTICWICVGSARISGACASKPVSMRTVRGNDARSSPSASSTTRSSFTSLRLDSCWPLNVSICRVSEAPCMTAVSTPFSASRAG